MIRCKNLLLGASVLAICFTPCCLSKKELYIGAFLSMSLDDGGWLAAGSLPALQIALEDVNNSTDILKDYELKLVLKDTKMKTSQNHPGVIFSFSIADEYKIVLPQKKFVKQSD